MCVFECVLPDRDVRVNVSSRGDEAMCAECQELWKRWMSCIFGSLSDGIQYHGVIRMLVSSLHIIRVGIEGTLVGSDPKAPSGATLISLPLWSLFVHSHCASRFSHAFSPSLCLPFFFTHTASLSAVLQQLLHVSSQVTSVTGHITWLAKSQWERKEITRLERKKWINLSPNWWPRIHQNAASDL